MILNLLLAVVLYAPAFLPLLTCRPGYHPWDERA